MMKSVFSCVCCILILSVNATAQIVSKTPLDKNDLSALDLGAAPTVDPPTTNKPVPLPKQADAFRKEFALKLRKGQAVRKDYDNCKHGIDTLELPEHKRPFHLQLAEYHRIIDRDSVKALEVLIPLVVPQEDADQWITDQRTAAQKAFDAWSQEYNDAKAKSKAKKDIPERPSGLFVEFPSAEKWKPTDDTAAVCVEIARNLALLNRQKEALGVIDTVGRNCDKEYRILAAEAAADIMVWMKMYGQGAEFYDFALKILRAVKENETEFRILRPDEERAVKNRIEYKLGAIRRLAEQDRFPPEWIAYREAQRKHLNEDAYLEALWMYLDVVKNYPDTVCAEASECYLIKMLCFLSNPAFVKEAAKRYEWCREQLDTSKAQLRQAKRTLMAPAFIGGLQAYIDRLDYVVTMWEKTPLGKKALQMAEERAEKFLAKNQYGLYRGEVLLDIGTAHLVSNFDLENGEKWLARGAEWFDSARQFDKDLKEFELPEQVRRASQPPKEERFKDHWNNVCLSKPKPGDLFNRRTCTWYWNSKRKEVSLLQGLTSFAKEEYGTAEQQWNLLCELDKEFYSQQQRTGWGDATIFSRLSWNLRYQKGSLYATPQEMASFKEPKRRLAVLVGDLFYESEQHKRALSIYQRLETGELGVLSKNEQAYVSLATFNCLCWDFGVDEISYIEPRIQAIIDTPSSCRILLGYSNRVFQRRDMVSYMRSLNALEYCLKRYPDSDDAETTLFFYIDRCKILADTFYMTDPNLAKELYDKTKKACDHYLSNSEMKLYQNVVRKIISSLPSRNSHS